jgi:hypothetical protein
MLTQNSELRKDRVWNWTLPAWVVRKSNGQAVNVCPQAGACVKFCYARNGTYNFPMVKAAHVRNLERVTDDLNGWTTDMLNELGKKKFRPTGEARLPDLPRDHLPEPVVWLLDDGAACIRVHDSGDFLSEEYLLAWLAIASHTPDVFFYCYTKEVGLFQRVVEGNAPANFRWCYSLGGKQDHLIDKDRDYHADVFADEAAVEAAGYYSQDENDLLCVLAPSVRIGIPANNIPHFKKKMAGRTFGEIEAESARHGRGAVDLPMPGSTAEPDLFALRDAAQRVDQFGHPDAALQLIYDANAAETDADS